MSDVVFLNIQVIDTVSVKDSVILSVKIKNNSNKSIIIPFNNLSFFIKIPTSVYDIENTLPVNYELKEKVLILPKETKHFKEQFIINKKKFYSLKSCEIFGLIFFKELDNTSVIVSNKICNIK